KVVCASPVPDGWGSPRKARRGVGVHRRAERESHDMQILESFIRWIHVGAGVVWIGHLYFFNWVNAPFAATLHADVKKKVVPELMPRALFWFRWVASWTWVSGILLLGMVFYQGRIVLEGADTAWSPVAIAMVALTFLAPFIYDPLMKSVKKPMAAAAIGWLCITAVCFLLLRVAHFSYRGMAIHIGAMLGTIMAFNVWFRIWPGQQKIITAVKNGTAPDAAVVALAGLRSRHNTYMSLPLLWMMINSHTTWASTWWYV